jgi:hypothetical protein
MLPLFSVGHVPLAVGSIVGTAPLPCTPVPLDDPLDEPLPLAPLDPPLPDPPLDEGAPLDPPELAVPLELPL